MQHKTYKFYSDSQHGWLAVKRRHLVSLGIAEQITHHSYQRGKTVYLEEDLDAGTFIEAFTRAFGHTPKLSPGKWCDHSPIRYYERFSVSA